MDMKLHPGPDKCRVCNHGSKRKWNASFVDNSGDGISLMLSLGHSQISFESSKRSTFTACTTSPTNEMDEGTSSGHDLDFDLNVDYVSSLEEPVLGTTKIFKTVPCRELQFSLLSGPSASVITDSSFHQNENTSGVSVSAETLPVINDGSISSHWTSGRSSQISFQDEKIIKSLVIDWENSGVIGSDLTALTHMPAHSSMKSSVTNAFGVTNTKPQRANSTKSCKFQGCTKGARGASGLCIAHGGGRRCQREGCNKGAEGRTVYCKAHGGGRRCEFLGCTKSAEGRTDYCIAHGGGRRCNQEGCTRAARGKSGLCIRHGGGKRCQKENCSKSAEGYSGFCIAHGGGRRCQFFGCTKGAQGSTFFCKAHGGGKRCTAPGCSKGAEGSTPFCKGHGGGKRCLFQGGGICSKSVHGGTMFCVAHGGGKRCAAPECTRSARGRTNFCVRHGGGKRCKAEGCSKSAQGRTDFCKAHGGGTRCSWGHAGSIHGVGDPPCDRFARGRTGFCTSHSAIVIDNQVNGAGSLVSGGTIKQARFSEADIKVAYNGDALASANLQGSGFVGLDSKILHLSQPTQPQPDMFTLPEGRVHGGKLMAMLSSCKGIENIAGGHPGAGPSVPDAVRLGVRSSCEVVSPHPRPS